MTTEMNDTQLILQLSNASKHVASFNDHLIRWCSIIGLVVVILLVIVGCINCISSKYHRIQKSSYQHQTSSDI